MPPALAEWLPEGVRDATEVRFEQIVFRVGAVDASSRSTEDTGYFDGWESLLLTSRIAPHAYGIIGVPEDERRSLLARAAAAGMRSVVALLLPDTAPDAPTIHAAASRTLPNVLEALLDAGAGVESPDENGRTLLCSAAALGREAIIDALLRRGADPSARDSHGRGPLHVAANRGALEAIRLLVAGADENARDARGATPLMAATSDAGISGGCLDALLDGEVEVDAADHEGKTALIRLIEQRAPSGRLDTPTSKAAVALVRAGASLTERDHTRRSALDHARELTREPAGFTVGELERAADERAQRKPREPPRKPVAKGPAPTSDADWLFIPSGPYTMGLTGDEALRLAETARRVLDEEQATDFDPLHGLRGAFDDLEPVDDILALAERLRAAAPLREVMLAGSSSRGVRSGTRSTGDSWRRPTPRRPRGGRFRTPPTTSARSSG